MGRILWAGLLLLVSSAALARADGRALPCHQAAAAGMATFEVTGDGKSPLNSQILVANQTARPLKVRLEAGTVLTEARRQDVMLVEDRDVDLPPHGAARATVASDGEHLLYLEAVGRLRGDSECGAVISV
ncbi:MAG: hypothetical protein FJX76_07305 [Armatimonadetes bacterium]|nr:hypothetical protein [Armatimonadota bacterium]